MRSRVAIPLLIAIASAALAGCEDRTGFEVGFVSSDTVTVTISGMSAPFNIDPDPAIVDPGTRLGFRHTTSDILEIDLRGMPRVAVSPFADSLLTAFDGEIAFTVVRLTAQPDTIKYSVTVTTGGQSSTQDPEIIVRPR